MRMNSRCAVVVAAVLAGSSTAAPVPAPLDPLFASAPMETRAALMIRGGRVIAKRYAPGYDDRTKFISWSMAKTVTAVLVGELVSDGRLQLDAPAPVAEWQKPGDPRRAITLRQLLHMASGLRHTEVGVPVEASDTNQVLFVGGTGAMAARAIGQPLEARPGAKFEYSSMTTIVLAEIVTRTLTTSTDPRERARAYQAFARERVFAPAGIADATFEFDGAGTQIGGSLIYMTLDDYARFGQLLLAGRGVGGAQVIAPAWLAFMKTPSPTDAEYGGQLWLNHSGGTAPRPTLFPDSGPATLVSCIGHLGQYVIASPDQDMVLVRLGKTNDGSSEAAALKVALARVVAAVPVVGATD